MTTKRKTSRTPIRTKSVPVDFVCLECEHGYRTHLPYIAVMPAKRAWSRVHWADNGCKVKGDLS